ncbi:MAG: hypothetical protein WAP03_20300 [Methylorubrum rhodinum]|uniref:hypothetical protein n=1 Tax=Methylorubrum rhodinum TaxID=29428 RepID=UPI003BAEB2C2
MTYVEACVLATRITNLGYQPTADEAESLAQAFLKLDGRFTALRSGVMDALDGSMENS